MADTRMEAVPGAGFFLNISFQINPGLQRQAGVREE
jgi:hypothetical protein